MSTIVPKFRTVNDSVVEIDDLNETFLDFVNETSSKLNEHNFVEDAFNTSLARRARFKFGCAYKIHRVYVETLPIDDSDYLTDPSIKNLGKDLSIKDTGLSVSFTTTGALLWILASFQFVQADIKITDLTKDGSKSYQKYFFRLNGAFLPESTIGSLDSNQDAEIGPAPLANAVCLETIQYAPPGPVNIDVLTQTDYKFIANNAVNAYIGNRELIVIEMVR